MFADGVLLALLGCTVVLTAKPLQVPPGMHNVCMDARFDPRAWFDAWLQRGSSEEKKPAFTKPARVGSSGKNSLSKEKQIA